MTQGGKVVSNPHYADVALLRRVHAQVLRDSGPAPVTSWQG